MALVHIYCGDGKGKTSAAVGMAVRAAGRGLKVVMVRFLKSDDSGEVAVLGHIPGITVIPCERTIWLRIGHGPGDQRAGSPVESGTVFPGRGAGGEGETF